MVTVSNTIGLSFSLSTLCAVKGLQILATFPEGFSPISNSLYEYILLTLISTISSTSENIFLWRLALKSLAHIGSDSDKHGKTDRALSYMKIVVEKIVSLLSNDDCDMPFPLKLNVAADIGTSGLNYMLRIVQGLEEAVYANLYEIYVCMPCRSCISYIGKTFCYLRQSNNIVFFFLFSFCENCIGKWILLVKAIFHFLSSKFWCGYFPLSTESFVLILSFPSIFTFSYYCH